MSCLALTAHGSMAVYRYCFDDERDAIVPSVGYHKDSNGFLAYRFGPMLEEKVERRLDVAVTRARPRLMLV